MPATKKGTRETPKDFMDNFLMIVDLGIILGDDFCMIFDLGMILGFDFGGMICRG